MTPRTAETPTLTPGARLWEWPFLLWIALLPVMQRFNLRVASGYPLLLPADFVFVPALAGFLAALIFGFRRFRPSTWYRPLLAYVCALSLSTLTSEDIHHSLASLAGNLYLITAALMTFHYVTDLDALRRTVCAWLAGATATILAAMAGIVLFFLGRTTPRRNPFLFEYGTLPPGYYPRVKALFLNPNIMCSYAAASALLILVARQAGWISREASRVLLAGAIIATISSLSPGLGGLALVLALWQAGVEQPRRRARRLATAGILVALVFLLVVTISPAPLVREPVAEALLHPEPGQRLLTWISAWHTFLAHPWTGRGLGRAAADVYYRAASGVLYHGTVAQNAWLSVMAQQGLAGVLAFAWVVFHLVRGFRLFPERGNRQAALRAGVELAFIAGFLYQSLTEPFENVRHVWVLMGLVAAVQEMTPAGGGASSLPASVTRG